MVDATLQEFLAKKIITNEQANEVLKYKNKYNKQTIHLLYELGFISKKEYLEYLAKHLNVKFIENLDNIRLRNIHTPSNILKKAVAIPINIKYDKVEIAMANPLDWNAKALIERFFPEKKIETFLALKEDIDKVLKKIEDKEKITTILNDIKRELKGEVVQGDEASIVKLIKYIIVNAINKKASDIHIEADEEGGEVRLRIFGSLYEFLDFDADIFQALSSRIKVLSGLDVSEKRKPQDGSFSMEFDGNKFDFRVSTLPTVWGESIVIRILDKRSILKKLEDIGIEEKTVFNRIL